MKKVFVFILLFALLISGCGYNMPIVDLNYKYTKAILITGDTTMEYEITSWKDWDGSDTVQFTTTSGQVIYTHTSNVILIGK